MEGTGARLLTGIFGTVTTKPVSILKTLLPLRGLAILLVVLAHAAIGMLAAETSLAPETALPVLSLGNWAIASFWKSLTLELCRCSVPLFLFLSGYYLLSTPRTWKAVWSACRKMLVPMMFWSIVGWAFSWRKGTGGWLPLEFLERLFTGTTQLGYFFIILLVQYYILSMWLFPAMEKKPGLVLVAAVALQLSAHGYDYVFHLSRAGLLPPMTPLFRNGYFPEFLFPRFMVSFTLGMWAAQRTQRFKHIIVDRYPLILLVAAGTAIVMMAVRGLLYALGRADLGMSVFDATAFSWAEWKLGTALWTIAAILFLFGAFQKRIPAKSFLELLGKNSLQIFLLHGITLDIVKMFLYKFSGSMRFYGFFGTVISLVAGIAVPILVAETIRKICPPWMRNMTIGSP